MDEEALRLEFDNLTTEWMALEEDRRKLLPPVANLTRGEKLAAWRPTETDLLDWDKLDAHIERIRNRRRDIFAQLVRARQ